MVSKTSAITQTQILNTAEQLFADRGLDSTTIRSIVKAAGVNLAAIHYHFGSKEDLILAALKRVTKPIVEAQVQQLAAVEKDSASPTIEAVLHSFFAPILEMMSSRKDRRGLIQIGFIGRCCIEPNTERLVAQEFVVSQQLLTSMFQRLLPNCSEAEIEWKLDFVIAILIRLMCTVYQSNAALQQTSRNEVESAIERLVKFAAAGMRA